MNELIINKEPFLGRLIVEVLRDSAEEHIKKQEEAKGVSREFLDQFEIVGTKGKKTQITKGKIVKMAPDAFGAMYKERYGEDGVKLNIGDVVYWIPNDSYRVDPNDEYHVISDCNIVMYEKGN